MSAQLQKWVHSSCTTCITIGREDPTMVCDFRSRPRTTAREVWTSMHRDHGIVISFPTDRMRLDCHLYFNLQNFTTMKTKS